MTSKELARALERSCSNTSADGSWKFDKCSGQGSPFGSMTFHARAGLMSEFRTICNDKGLSPYMVVKDMVTAFVAAQKRIPLDDMIAFENGWVDEMTEVLEARERLYLAIREKMANNVDIEAYEEDMIGTLLSDQRRLEGLEIAVRNGDIVIDEEVARKPSFVKGSGLAIGKGRKRK